MSRVIRRQVIDRRRRKRKKYLKIRARIAKAKNANEIQGLITKLLNVNPHYPVASFSKAK
jgi:hypothetical protein